MSGLTNLNALAANALGKFLELNDDLSATEAVNRRMLFEFLRAQPTLSVKEIEIMHTISDLLAELRKAQHCD